LSETGAVERLDERRNDATVRVPPGLPVPTYPVVVNAPVEALIDHFVAKDRERFGMWISRSGRYLPMIQRIFRERGLPEELAYTAMIESGLLAPGGFAGRREGDVAVHGGHGPALRARHRPVDRRAARSREVDDGGGRVPGRPLRPVRHWFLAQAGYNAGEIGWAARSSGPGPAISGR
jgi:membrane-bound lytic murein transglycosylase D